MGISLNILTGPSAGRIVRLATGTTARFGKTEWADFSFPHDALMSEVHFIIECGHRKCVIRDLASESGTFVQGTRITEVTLRTGDNIVAGQTTFCANIDGETEPDMKQGVAATAESSPDQSKTVLEPPPSKSLIELCQFLKLDDAACGLAKEAEVSPQEFVKRLTKEQNRMSALRLTAHLLSPKPAVMWGSICTRESVGTLLSDTDLVALDAADRWVKSGNENDRRLAHEAAEATRYETAAGWVALGAFWAEGSLAPTGLADVVPDERLTGQAITGALLMAAVQVNPLRAEINYDRFLSIADEIISRRVATSKE
jgi:pSer/pThr/pTyr-binding forkhead associated (FHA) protein